MHVKKGILAAALLLGAVVTGLAMPQLMTQAQSALAEPVTEYEMPEANLEYTRQLTLVEKYSLMQVLTSLVEINAGHLQTEAEVETIAENFLRAAFGQLDLQEVEIRPVLIVADGMAFNAWAYRAFQPLPGGEGQMWFQLCLDDTTGAVLKLEMRIPGDIPMYVMLGELYGLQEALDEAQVCDQLVQHLQAAINETLQDTDLELADPEVYLGGVTILHWVLAGKDTMVDLELQLFDFELYLN